MVKQEFSMCFYLKIKNSALNQFILFKVKIEVFEKIVFVEFSHHSILFLDLDPSLV